MNEQGILIPLLRMGKTTAVEKQIQNGANPNERDQGQRTPLHWAAQEGFIRVLRCLIKFHAELNARDRHGFTPLAVAAGEGHAVIVRELLNAGASPNIKINEADNTTALHLACSWNRVEVVKTLVASAETDINARDDTGKTPLAYAIEVGNKNLVNYLIKHGAIV